MDVNITIRMGSEGSSEVEEMLREILFSKPFKNQHPQVNIKFIIRGTV